jgi:hypothetical protein
MTTKEDFSEAADVEGPLDAETLASLDQGLADIAAGRVKTLDEYKCERGL